MRILYLDDEPDLLEIGKAFLEKSQELLVDTALSAAEAKDRMSASEYDAVISDYQMPVMDGIQFLKELREKGDQVPFILFTGKGREEVVIEALNSGADFYLQKGGNPQAQFIELEHKVKEAVRRSRAEQGMCRSEGRFRTLFENMLNGFAYCQMIYDDQGRAVDFIYLDVNKAFGKLTGLEGVEGKRVSDVIPGIKDTEPELMETYGRVANGGPPETMILFFKPLSMWLHLSVFCTEPGRFVAVFENISELKKIEQEALSNEYRFRVISENSPDHIVIMDKELRYTWVQNPQLGLTIEEMIGHTDYDILPHEEAEALVKAKSEVLRTGQEMRFSRSLISRDGSIQYFDGVFKPSYSQGEIDGVMGYFRNVTDVVTVQNALREANHKMSILASITRHDIYNKLNVLEGYLDILRSEVQRDDLDPVFKKLKDAVRTIGSYTKFTKAYENVGRSEPVWQDLHELIELAMRNVPAGDIRIVNDVPAGKEALLDPMAEKVMVNLIDNVVRHGRKATHLRFYLDLDEGRTDLICEDDGVGIPGPKKEQLFTRAESSDHGLGLFLCREILGITGFAISENGAPGGGARFMISAPADGLRNAKH